MSTRNEIPCPLPLLLGIFSAVAFSACVVELPELTDETDETDETGGTDETDETATLESTSGPEHCGEITTDEIWAADLSPHIITCDVLVEGGSLTIGPGVEVLAANDVGILVSRDGGSADLSILGSAEAPVEMRAMSGVAPGLWKGLSAYPASGELELHHTSIASGGGLNAQANIFVDDNEILLDHVTSTNAAEWGLALLGGAALDPASTALQIHETAGWPVRVGYATAHTLPATDSDYSGNDNDGIYMIDIGPIAEEVAWEDLGVAYYAYDSVIVEGEAAGAGVLELQPGVVVKFDTTAALELARYGGAGGLRALGEADDPVVLSSINSLDRGAWPGLAAHDNTVDEAFELVHTVIEWGGGFNSIGCLHLDDTSVAVDHLSLVGCEDAGFELRTGAYFRDGSVGLLVDDSDRSGAIRANWVGTLPTVDVELTGNDADLIDVQGEASDLLDHPATWANLGVPYRHQTHLQVEGDAFDPAILTLEPGVVMAFVEPHALWLSRGGGASGLLAQGTAEQPIVFTAASALDPGAWGGIFIHDSTVDDQTVLDQVEVRWGSGLNSLANISIENASPTITNAIIAGSDCWGLHVSGDSEPMLSNVTYMDNTCGDVGP